MPFFKCLTKFLSLIAITTLLIGCSTSMILSMDTHEQHFNPANISTDKALVYFYRESSFVGALRGIHVTANGERIGGLNSGTYFVYEADPGEYTFSVENWLTDDPSRTITVEAGKSYYLRGVMRMGLIEAAPTIKIADNREGAAIIRELEYATVK